MEKIFKINIPKEPVFFQEYNHRSIIGLFPQLATWDDNSVWEIQIVQITNDTIRRTTLRTNKKELSDIIRRFGVRDKLPEHILRDKVVYYLRDFYTENRATKEDFVSKYNKFQQKISELL